MNKILLLDIENISKNGSELLQLFKQYQIIYLVYAKATSSITLDNLIPLAEYIHKNKLVLIKMPHIGKNSADFGLAFLAGQLSIQLDSSQHKIDIMSNDKAMEYIIDLLKIHKFTVEQIKTATPTANIQTPSNMQDLLLKAKKILQKNKPKSQIALNNALTNYLKCNSNELSTVIELLVKDNILKIQKDEIIYPSQQNSFFDEQSNEIPKEDDLYQKPHLQYIKKYCDYLAKIDGRSRPQVEKSLKNSIRSVLKLEHEQIINNIFNMLKQQKIFTMQNKRFIYNHNLIMQWANIPFSSEKLALYIKEQEQMAVSL